MRVLEWAARQYRAAAPVTETGWVSCETGGCLEVARQGEAVLIRETTTPDELVITNVASLAAFIDGVKAGKFDHLLS